MGFNKYYVPEPAELVKQIYGQGPVEFAKSKRNIDAMIGSTDSVRIVEHVLDLFQIESSDSDMIASLVDRFPAYFE